MTARLSVVFSRHGYLLAILAIALSTVLFLAGRDLEAFAKGQWALLYLLTILLVAGAAGTRPAILASVLAFFTWNFFFLPPYHTLRVRDPKDWLSLVALLVVGLLVGIQTGRLREREARAIAREQEAVALNRLSAAVAGQTSTEQMTETCLSEIVQVLGAGAASLFVLDGEDLRWCGETLDRTTPDPAMGERARRALNDELAQNAEERVSGAPATVVAADDGGLYAVVHSPSGVAGALAVQARTNAVPYSADAARLVVSLANLVGAFFERERLQAAATTAAAEREADRLKSSLLSSVSHELKTPLAALTATVSNLLESDVDWDEQSVRDELRDRWRRRPAEQQHRRAARPVAPRGPRLGTETRAVRAQRHHRRRHRGAPRPSASACHRRPARHHARGRRRLLAVGPRRSETARECGPLRRQGLPSDDRCARLELSLIHISEPTRLGMISYAVFC